MSYSSRGINAGPNYVAESLLFLAITSLLTLMGCAASQGGLFDRGIPVDSLEQPIAYINHPDAGRSASRWERELMVVDAASGKTWQLTSNQSDERAPVWSPSGSHLLYLSREVSMRPGMRNRGEYRLMVHDLKSGKNRKIDLSWARKSGPAAPNRPVDDIPTWLEHAAWSPVDTTKIAVAVQVDRATFGDPDGEKNRIVLLDTEEKTGRLLADGVSSNGLNWSPDGKHLNLGFPGGIIVLNVESRKPTVIKGGHTLKGDSLSYSIADWRGEEILIRGYSLDIPVSSLYEYDWEEKTWSGSKGTFPDSIDVVGYAASDSRANKSAVDYIVRRDSGYYSDIWRYRRPEGKYERLTDDGMPKQDATVYSGEP